MPPTSKGPEFSRRDFLKLAAAATVAVAVGGCAPKYEPPGELPRISFDREYVVYNGKTVSINELDINALAFYSSIKEKLNKIFSGDMSVVSKPSNFAGAPFSEEGWQLSPDRVAIFLNDTEDGDIIASAVVGRQASGSNPLSGEGEFNNIINGIKTASAYAEHSFLVVGRGDRSVWFDNMESINEKGERVRIVLDAASGRVYQIVTNSPNFIESYFEGQEVKMEIGEMNILKNEKNFTSVLTPFSSGFINFLQYFINRLPQSMSNSEKLEQVKYFFSGLRLNSSDQNRLEKLLGEGDDVQQIISVLSRYNVNIPFDNYELAFVNSVLANNLKKIFKW